ncbi:MAG: hypothetical protein ACOCWJ_00535 [Verrucomicrobiota bacterium]
MGRDSKPQFRAGETAAARKAAESSDAEQSAPFERQSKGGGGKGSNRGVKALLTILILLVLGGGGAYWYYTFVYKVAENGDSEAPDRAESLVAETESLMKAEEFDEALELADGYVRGADPDSAVVARLRELVAPALEQQVRQLREPKIREQRREWEERSEKLVEQARIEAERERERQEAEERQKERELEQQREREREEQRLARLNQRRNAIRRQVVENCRKREYSRASLAPLALQSVEEKEFSQWAKNMERMVQMAKECFDTVSGSDERLRGFECLPENWPNADNFVDMKVNYISNSSVFLRYTRKVYEEGIFRRNESGVANVQFEDVQPAAMARLFNEAWERAEGDDPIRRDMLFAAYLISEARALDRAEERLEGTSGADTDFMEEEIKAMQNLEL